MQHERATRTFIKQKPTSFLHHPHHGSHHTSLAASLTGSLHHSIPHSSSLQGSPTHSDVTNNLSSFASLTGLPVNNAAAAAILAAHGHNSTMTSPYHSSSLANFHSQSPHHLGVTGGGVIPNLSQYFSSEACKTGSSNGAFSSYNPLAAHLKAAFPSIFPQLYVHTHQPPIFSPPPMIPPPPLVSPPKTILNNNFPSNILRSSPPTHIPSPLVASEEEGKQGKEGVVNTDVSKGMKLDCETEIRQLGQTLIEKQKLPFKHGISPISTPSSINNNVSDDEFVSNKPNIESPSCSHDIETTRDSNRTERSGEEKNGLDSTIIEKKVSVNEDKGSVSKASCSPGSKEATCKIGKNWHPNSNYDDAEIRNEEKRENARESENERLIKDGTHKNESGIKFI